MAEAQKIKPTLPPSNFTQDEFTSSKYRAIVPAGHTKADMEDANYWCHIANKLRRHSEITVVADDFTFYGKALVMACTQNQAIVWFVVWTKRQDVELPESDTYKIGQNANGFRIIQRATGKPVKEGFPTRKAAVEAMIELEKV